MEFYYKLKMILHSAKGLDDVKFFGTMNPYALMWVAGAGKQSAKYTTTVATDAGCNPVWNSSWEFNVCLLDNYTFYVDIKHDGTLFDRDIGEVRLSFKDLLARGLSGERVSFPVTTSYGEVTGEINLSYKFTKLAKSRCASTSTIAVHKTQESDCEWLKLIGKATVSIVLNLLDLPDIDFD